MGGFPTQRTASGSWGPSSGSVNDDRGAGPGSRASEGFRKDVPVRHCGKPAAAYVAPVVIDEPAGEQLGDRVHQAQMLVAAQANCDMLAALAALIIKATETHQTLNETALDVLDGIIRFDS